MLSVRGCLRKCIIPGLFRYDGKATVLAKRETKIFFFHSIEDIDLEHYRRVKLCQKLR